MKDLYMEKAMHIYNVDLEEQRSGRNMYNLDKIVIFGCGGHARSIINVLCEENEKIDIILVDENAGRDENILNCKAVREYELKDNDGYIIAIGDNARRRELYNCLINRRIGHCISVISKYAHVGICAKIGNGTFVASNAYIGPQAEIGNNVIINTGSVIEHEVKIGDNTHIAPNTTICGRTGVGSNVFCGAGSIVIDKVAICEDVIIGAGAVVKENITSKGTYVGVPAKKVH